MKKNICEELPKYKKDIVIGVITTLLSTFILNVFPKIAVSIYNDLLNIADNFTAKYSNDVFQTISLGNTKNYINTVFLILIYFIFIFITTLPTDKSPYEYVRFFSKIFAYLFIIFTLYCALKDSYINRCVVYMNQNIKIASCYLTDDEIKALNAEYYAIESKNDYVDLLNKLEELAEQHGTKFYDPFS